MSKIRGIPVRTTAAMKTVIKYYAYSNLDEAVFGIGANEIHVWEFNIEVYEKLSAHYFEYLSEEETKRVERFRKINDKKQYVIGHIFLRILLSKYLEIPIHQISLFRDLHGKIKLEGNGGNISFNLSHSDEMVVLAFSKYKDLGVDIERIHNIQDFLQIAQLYFRKEEYDYISKIDAESPLSKFYKVWTIKEAFVKATGEGLSRSLKTFSVETDSVISIQAGQDTIGVWRHFELEMDRNYAATVVINVS